jgi:uncharacterized protein (TIGR03086 family)
MQIRELDRKALDTLGALIAEVKPDHYRLPTPCDDWTLYGLIRHQVSDNLGFAAAARGAGPDIATWNAGRLGDDPYAAYQASADAFTQAFADDDVLDRDLIVREFGSFPGRVALSMHVLDCTVHGWDVAQSLGVPYDPPGDLVEHSLAVAGFIPADDREERGSFRPVVQTGDETPLARLLALTGRRHTG